MKANKAFESESGRLFNEGDTVSLTSLELSGLTADEIKENFGEKEELKEEEAK